MMPRTHTLLPRFRRAATLATMVGAAFMSASCASLYVEELAQVSTNTRDFHIPTALGVEACRASLENPRVEGAPRLDPANIRIVNWNVRKKSEPSWKDDYRQLADGRDLVLFQEASLREDTINDLDASKHWSFAPGFRTEDQISGVLTLSSVKPLTQCSFVTLEPVLRTPKATNITQYALTEAGETLVVVNVHAVNFSLGMGAFRSQFGQIADALAGHRGPVILSGDFNTWGKRRMLVVNSLAEDLGLSALEFEEDHRVRILGRTIDHIYVRGLSAIASGTRDVTTSDHNPMSATLTM